MPIILSAPAKRKNGRKTLTEEEKAAGFLIEKIGGSERGKYYGPGERPLPAGWSLTRHGRPFGIYASLAAALEVAEGETAEERASAPAKRKNGARRDVLSEDARKSGYYVATYSPGDGKTRYRFFDLADMARSGVSTAEQDYFGPLNGIHTAVGLAAAKKFLNAPAKRKNTRRKAALPPMRNPYFGSGLLHDDDVFLDLLAIWKRGVSPDVKPHRLRKYTEQQTKKFYEHYGSGILNDAAEYEMAVEDWARAYPPKALAAAPAKRANGRKAPARRNGSRSTVDPVAARELELYIENEANLVGPGNSLGANIMRMLAGRIVRGTYDSTKAWKAWVPLTTEGAKRYKREIGPINASKATRDAVATRLSEAFESEVRSGGLDPMKLLGKR